MNTDSSNNMRGMRFSLPGEKKLKRAIDSFSLSQKVIFYFLLTLFIISTLGLIHKLNNEFLVKVPDKGGKLTEGVLGTPRFVNPLLSLSDADRDVTVLVYSGLMRLGPDGQLITDLAESYSISPDGLIYNFKIKENAKFHDGRGVTADDIEYTVLKAQDATLKSPRRGNWEGITVEKIDSREINFILKQPYAPFLENTTLGILPKHIWKDASPDEFSFNQHNIEAIGSGPYRVKSIGRNSSGIPNQYNLRAFSEYALGEPFITELNLKFYSNEENLVDAYKKGEVESINGISPRAASLLENDGVKITRVTLPRIFGVFFNQNQAQVFSNKEVREALDVALDKKRLVDEALLGYGSTISGPIPLSNKASLGSRDDSSEIEEAKKILESNGWEFSSSTQVYEKKTRSASYTLSFSIATGDSPELKTAAQIIKEQWEALGAQVEIQIFEIGDLNQNIIRPRKYDSLLFGEIIGRDLDLYPFWHSSQRNDPGLNIALYANISADKSIEEARTSIESEVREEKLLEFLTEIENDKPAVFTFSPDFLYIVSEKVGSVNLSRLTIPSERFSNVWQWYIETNKVWKIFN